MTQCCVKLLNTTVSETGSEFLQVLRPCFGLLVSGRLQTAKMRVDAKRDEKRNNLFLPKSRSQIKLKQRRRKFICVE